MPANGISGKEPGEELRDNTQAAGFVAVDGLVVFCELSFEEVGP